jgi:molybdate transport system permease protein
MDTQALWLTLRLALSTTALLLLLALPLARWIAAGSGPLRALRPGHRRAPARPAAHRPRLLPAGRARPAHRARPPHHPPPRTPARLLLLRPARRLGPLQPALCRATAGRRLPRHRPRAARSRRHPRRLAPAPSAPSPFRWPSHRILTAAVLTFTHTVGEFGVVLMLGGNIPGATRTLSIALYDQVQDFDYAAANRTAAPSSPSASSPSSPSTGAAPRGGRCLPDPAPPHLSVQLRHRIGALQIDVAFQLTQPWTILFGPSGSGKDHHPARHRRPAPARLRSHHHRSELHLSRHRNRCLRASAQTHHHGLHPSNQASSPT